jgi:hypothetical protein
MGKEYEIREYVRREASRVKAVRFLGGNVEEVERLTGGKRAGRTMVDGQLALNIVVDENCSALVHDDDWVVQTASGFELLSDEEFRSRFSPPAKPETQVVRVTFDVKLPADHSSDNLAERVRMLLDAAGIHPHFFWKEIR